MNDLDKKLDTIHSIYIRLKHTDENGIGYCYTSNVRVTFKTAQCGHYITRSNTQYRWDENNTRIQSEDANCFKGGEPEKFRDRLIHELGSVKVAEMEFKSRKPFLGWTKFEKRVLLLKRQKQCRELLQEKNFNLKI